MNTACFLKQISQNLRICKCIVKLMLLQIAIEATIKSFGALAHSIIPIKQALKFPIFRYIRLI
ncbi:hypothetical protein B5F19_05930 [Pseudoflavonifractor sp. An184]|nr:hypothetical protein B5F19_05930 [Pseudoflavonifractor sp. An184]